MRRGEKRVIVRSKVSPFSLARKVSHAKVAMAQRFLPPSPTHPLGHFASQLDILYTNLGLKKIFRPPLTIQQIFVLVKDGLGPRLPRILCVEFHMIAMLVILFIYFRYSCTTLLSP